MYGESRSCIKEREREKEIDTTPWRKTFWGSGRRWIIVRKQKFIWVLSIKILT
jgi:hypothetical protein